MKLYYECLLDIKQRDSKEYLKTIRNKEGEKEKKEGHN